MTVHTLKFTQGGGTLFDLTDLTKSGLLSWSIDAYPDGAFAKDTLTFHLRGTSIDNLFENLITLNRILLNAEDNENRGKRGQAYTPIFLQFQEATATYLVQSEVFGDKLEKLSNLLDRDAIHANRIQNISFTVRRRGYFEETAAVPLAGSPFTVSNNGALCNIASTDIRGDLPAPLKIVCRTAAANYTQVMAALKADNTVANFVCKYEAEAYSARGAGVADLSDSNLSPGGAGVTGQRWTPANTNELSLVKFGFTNAVDQYGQFRLLVRCRDNAASTPNIKIRARVWRWDSASGLFLYGEWGDGQKFLPVVGGTTILPIVDCGLLTAPISEIGSLGLSGSSSMGFEVSGQAVSTATTFDLDCCYTLTGYEGGDESGFFSAAFPFALGTNAVPDAVLDSNDRMPDASLIDGSGNAYTTRHDPSGKPIFVWPGRAQKLVVMADIAANGTHQWNHNNTVTVTYTPRYRVARGST